MVFLTDLTKRPVGLVGERRLLGIELKFLDQLGEFLLGELGALGEHLRSLFLPPVDQHTLQAANHNDGQDDVLILISFKLATQPFGRFPNLVGEVIELRFVQ